MNRLTKKNNIGYFPTYERETKENYYDLVHKLGVLEDLEEEINIDLITLFKTLKQKFVFNKENVKIELLGLHIKSNELYLYGFVEDTTHAVYLSLKEYGKTWTLTREKLENEKENYINIKFRRYNNCR